MKRAKKNPFKIAGMIYLVVILSFILIPLFVMIFDSFKMTGDLLTPNINLDAQLTFNNYLSVFQKAGFGKAILNSLFIASCVTALTVICGATASYSFTRFHVFGSKQLSNSILIARMIPSVVLAIPLYIVSQKLQMTDSYTMIILAITTFALPFQIWMLIGFFAQIPKSLDEAARIDGCNYFQTFLQIVVPSAAPGLAATAIMTLFFSWNELFFALVLCGSRTKIAPMAIMEFMGYRNFDWGAILASGVVLMFPTLLVGIVFKRYMTSGLTAGAIKG